MKSSKSNTKISVATISFKASSLRHFCQLALIRGESVPDWRVGAVPEAPDCLILSKHIYGVP